MERSPPARGKLGLANLVLNQAADFDLARALSDRSRRSLPCDRSRRPDAHQTIPSETALATPNQTCLAVFQLPPLEVSLGRRTLIPVARCMRMSSVSDLPTLSSGSSRR